MKSLFIECNMGAAGDMLMAALLELHPDPDSFINRLGSIGIPDVTVSRESSVKCGIVGTHVRVVVGGKEEHSEDVPHEHDHEHDHEHEHHHDHEHEHHHDHEHEHHHDHEHEHHEHHNEHGQHSHNGMSEIEHIIGHLQVSSTVKLNAITVYNIIADAESKAHGKPIDAVHFHEVGMMDAVADIVGVCMLLEELAPDRIVVSPINVGSGQVRCAHGILPVPAPATATILTGVPSYSGQVSGELCTPTGAALLRHFADEWGNRPAMLVEKVGYGMGSKDFPAANCVRVFVGESSETADEVVEIACNLDDMTGEELGFALETLLESGALDVYTVPIQMKKSRPAQMLVCLCTPDDEDKLVRLIMQHTTTFGVRCSTLRRHTLTRRVEAVDTKYGAVRVKTGSGLGITKSKAEYEDIARLAREQGCSVMEIKSELK